MLIFLVGVSLPSKLTKSKRGKSCTNNFLITDTINCNFIMAQERKSLYLGVESLTSLIEHDELSTMTI